MGERFYSLTYPYPPYNFGTYSRLRVSPWVFPFVGLLQPGHEED